MAKYLPSGLSTMGLTWWQTSVITQRQQLQALALQPAVWGISCLVLLPFPWNDSSLYLSFSNICKATTVTHTKRIDRNLLRKETSFFERQGMTY